jgi:hypothetical protein
LAAAISPASDSPLTGECGGEGDKRQAASPGDFVFREILLREARDLKKRF